MSLSPGTDLQITSQQLAVSRSRPKESAQHGFHHYNGSSNSDRDAAGERRAADTSVSIGRDALHSFDAELGSTLDDAYYARKKAALRSQHRHKGKGRQQDAAARIQRDSPSGAADDSTIQGCVTYVWQ